MKTSLAILAAGLLLLVGAAWQMRHSEPMSGWLAGAARPGAVSADRTSPAGAPSPRKCLQAKHTVYTDGACPDGSREQTVSSDRVSVVPATPVPKSPAAAATASLPNARDILGRPDDGTLRDQRMERQINKD